MIEFGKTGVQLSRDRKLIDKIRQRPTRMRFREIVIVLEMFGMQERRTKGSHVWFSGGGYPPISIPTKNGTWVDEEYLDQICKLLKLDEINSASFDGETSDS